MTLSQALTIHSSSFEAPRFLYLHIPFCSKRCDYCDFHSLAASALDQSIMTRYIDVLIERIHLLEDCMQPGIETIYIGGGTPTSLRIQDFERLIAAVSAFAGSGLKEWTVEANPECLNEENLGIMARNAVTRVSLGIQSMDAEELRILGRNASREENSRALKLLCGSGLAVSADLIAAVPYRGTSDEKSGRTPGQRMPLHEQADYLANLGVQHISMYDLVVEEGTAIARHIEDRSLVTPDEDESYEARKAAEKNLKDRGYRRYEVSNFAMPGKESIHNSAYWSMNSYLGLGSGAVSTLQVLPGSDEGFPGRALRLVEGKDLARYMDLPDASAHTSWIGLHDVVCEFVMMGLRTAKGLDIDRFSRLFGIEPHALLAHTINVWGDRISMHGGHLRVDDRGLDILNRILVSAFEDIDHFFKSEGKQA